MIMASVRVILAMAGMASLLTLATCDCQAPDEFEEKSREPPAKHTNIILLGATGDLATRYLWPGFFTLFKKNYEENKHHFSFYACGRRGADEGRKIISKTMLNLVQCTDDACRDMKSKFVSAVQYHPLATEEDYAELASKVNENTQSMYGLQGTEFSTEEGRLVYLSILPSAYKKTSKLVHKYLRPKLGRPWFRVVLEKPFGHDLASAQDLAESVAEVLEESETYRIDHYLGKPVVKYILPFRQLNKEKYEKLWNRHHIERVEIAMKEKLDVQGRTDFFDEVGVIRDVMQNHLTEIMAVVAMELPHDPSNITLIQEEKIRLLRHVEPPRESDILVAQYASYAGECQKDLKKPDYISKTPTYAAQVLRINNQRWQGVPFVLVSGKKLDVKSSHVRIIFKPDTFCVHEASQNCGKPKQLFFLIGSGDVKKPSMITWSNSLPTPRETPGWKMSELKLDTHIFGEPISDTAQLMPLSSVEAYTALIEAVYEGQRHLFIDTPSLLEAWKIWTPVLQFVENRQPRIYEGYDADMHLLDAEITDSGFQFVHGDQVEVPMPGEQPVFQQVSSTFRDNRLVSGELSDVIHSLADAMVKAAEVSFQQTGAFHLALSGGTSPIKLLQHITSSLPTFPWERTHLWWVDERCVPLDDANSNFNMVQTHLLKFVNIPYLNIHPMPVHIGDSLCSPQDNGAKMYSDMLKELVPDTRLDFALLGMGKDGHTASLFPGQPSLKSSDLVLLSRGVPPVENRMTMSYSLINNAKNVAVLVTGKDKHEMLHTISGGEVNVDQYPVTGIKPTEGDLVWYADYSAILENQ